MNVLAQHCYLIKHEAANQGKVYRFAGGLSRLFRCLPVLYLPHQLHTTTPTFQAMCQVKPHFISTNVPEAAESSACRITHSNVKLCLGTSVSSIHAKRMPNAYKVCILGP